MLGAFIKPRKQASGLWGHYRFLVVFSCKRSNSLYRIEPHDRNELGLISQIPAQELNPTVTGDLPVLYPDKNLAPQKRFIGVGVCWSCPAVPNSTNHNQILKNS